MVLRWWFVASSIRINSFLLPKALVVIDHCPLGNDPYLFSIRLLNWHNAIVIALSARCVCTLQAHAAGIISIRCEVLPEPDILLVDCVLADMRKEQYQPSSYEGKSGSHEEGITTRSDFVIACSFLKCVQSVRAGKGTDLAYSGCNTVVLSSV